MQVRIIKSYRDVVAVCDSELIGKRFEEGQFQLEVKEGFYKGEEMNEKQVLDIMRRMAMEDATFNIVGKKSVELAIKAGVILKKGTKTVQGIPFAMILM